MLDKHSLLKSTITYLGTSYTTDVIKFYSKFRYMKMHIICTCILKCTKLNIKCTSSIYMYVCMFTYFWYRQIHLVN